MKISIAGWFKSLFPQKITAYHAILVENTIEHFANSLPAGSEVLDAGAGEMPHKKYFRKAKYSAIDVAYPENNWDYQGLDYVADLEDMKVIGDSSFDAIICNQVLEHVKHPQLVINEFFRILKPGGKVLVTVPQGFEDHQEPHNYFYFTKHGLKLLFNEAGFENTEVEYLGGYYAFLSHWLRNFWFNMGNEKIMKYVDLLLYPIYFIASCVLLFLDRFDKKRKLTVYIKFIGTKHA